MTDRISAEAGHTKGEWQVHGSHIYGPDPERELIAQVVSNGGRLVADRDRIVRCVNSHNELVEALRLIRHQWGGHSEQCAYALNYKDKCDCDWPKIAAKCDAALSRAQGTAS